MGKVRNQIAAARRRDEAARCLALLRQTRRLSRDTPRETIDRAMTDLIESAEPLRRRLAVEPRRGSA